MASVPRLQRSLKVMQKRIVWAAAPSLILLSVSCKQRTMNESASPDSIGATYDGKENFLWPLIKQQLNNSAAPKEVCWYSYNKDIATAGATGSETSGSYTPQQMREFFLKASPWGLDSSRFIPVTAFKDEAKGAANADTVEYFGNIGVCSGAVGTRFLFPQPGLIGNAVRGLALGFCIGRLATQAFQNPAYDNTGQDKEIHASLDSFLNYGFLEDRRIPAELHKSLDKTITKVSADYRKNPKNKLGEKCPSTTDALAQVDATMRAIYDAQTPPSATP